LGGKASSERADPAVETENSSLSELTQTRLGFTESHFDGNQVRDIGGR
jgi:hypothetical protein